MSIEPLRAALCADRLTQTALPDGTGVILDLDGHQVLTLNQTGMYLVEQLRSGAASTSELVDRLTGEFDVATEAAQADVDEFVRELAELLRIPV